MPLDRLAYAVYNGLCHIIMTILRGDTLEYSKDVPYSQIHTYPIEKVWSPYFDTFKDIPLIYVFRKRDQAFYIGKTLNKGRERFRWHLRNTFAQTELDDLTLDILIIAPEKRQCIDVPFIQEFTPLEYYEAILIRQFLPLYNVNIAKTYRKLHNIPHPDDSLRCMIPQADK